MSDSIGVEVGWRPPCGDMKSCASGPGFESEHGRGSDA